MGDNLTVRDVACMPFGEIHRRLLELESSNAALTQERDGLEERLRASVSMNRDEVWYWQDNEEDHLESLTCPVVINSDTLRRRLAASRRKALMDAADAFESGEVLALTNKDHVMRLRQMAEERG